MGSGRVARCALAFGGCEHADGVRGAPPSQQTQRAATEMGEERGGRRCVDRSQGADNRRGKKESSRGARTRERGGGGGKEGGGKGEGGGGGGGATSSKSASSEPLGRGGLHTGPISPRDRCRSSRGLIRRGRGRGEREKGFLSQGYLTSNNYLIRKHLAEVPYGANPTKSPAGDDMRNVPSRRQLTDLTATAQPFDPSTRQARRRAGFGPISGLACVKLAQILADVTRLPRFT